MGNITERTIWCSLCGDSYLIKYDLPAKMINKDLYWVCSHCRNRNKTPI